MATKLKVVEAAFGLDEVIAGYNPERADIDNPDGRFYDCVLLVSATTADGRRFIHERTFGLDEDRRAARLVERVMGAGEIDLRHWGETFEVYGSPAWEAADAERALEWASNPNTAGFIRDF